MTHHFHNAVHLTWLELARMGFLRRFIAPDHDWRTEGLILARNSVDHRLPIYLNDVMEAAAWGSAIATKSFDLRYTLTRAGEGSGICAEGRSVMVCYDYKAERSITLPTTWRSALVQLLIP